MIYQFEHEEIDICNNCPMCVRVIDTEGCMLTESLISGSKSPQENSCPLVAISKTETTSEPCKYCDKPIYLKWNVSFIDGYYKLNDDCNYCPNCGRKLD